MEDPRERSSSDDPATPAAADPRGENLASHELTDPGAYEIAADETEAEELVDTAPDSDAEVEIDDLDQLADAEADARDGESTTPRTAAEVARAARPKRKAPPVAKAAPTPSRKRARPVETKRTTPVQFVGQSVDELKKVMWPTGQQVRQYFAVVLVFVLFIMAYVVALDTGFGAALLKLLG